VELLDSLIAARASAAQQTGAAADATASNLTR